MQDVTSPLWKTIYEIFKKVVSDYRESDHRDAIILGVEGNRTERELLLDDNIQQHDERQKTHRKERTKMKRRLQEAADWMRTAAVQRAYTVAVNDDWDEINEVSPPVTARSVNGRYKRRREVIDWERDDDEWIKEVVKMLSTVDKEKIKKLISN